MRLRAWVEALCSDACAGRETGSRQGAAARGVIVTALGEAGLAPSEQPVPASGGVNVLARVGTGSRIVLVGAHYDHLGGRYLGADDNAAAVAVLLELAHALRAAPPPAGCSVLLVAFDGEEPPHFMTEGMGSLRFVREPPLPLADIELAIVMDLVGHAVGRDGAPPEVRKSLFVLGAEKSVGTAGLVDAFADAAVIPRRAGIDAIPPLSDYEPFRRAAVPFLFLTCGRWRHYHETSDTPDVLDYAKLAGVARYVEHLVRGALARGGRPAYDDGARDHDGTVATLSDLAAALGARPVVGRLQGIRGRMVNGRCSLSDWSQVLQVLTALEQGLG